MNLASLNVADDPLVLSHEFAHLFGDFADEYVYEGEVTWDAPNCDSEYEICPKFSIVEGSECLVGCVNNENSRSVKVGIMRDYWSSKRYGLYNEWFLEKLILEKTKESGEVEVKGSLKKSPEIIFLVNGKCVKDECEIVDVGVSSGYVSSDKFVDSNLKVRYGDSLVGIPRGDRIMLDYGPSGDVVYVDSYEFSVAVPVEEEVDNIVLEKDGEVEDIFEVQGIALGYGQIVNIEGVTES